MHDKIKKNGQASMEYIMVLSIIMLVFMMVMYIIYEKNMEIIETKTYLDAKRITNMIVSNLNTISEQGDGYYKYFTIPDTLYRDYDYEIIISGNTVELRWGLRPYLYSKSPITANVHGFLFKGLNKVLNCGGEIYAGYPPISCVEALANIPPAVNISYPVPGTFNCTPFVIKGTAHDVNGTVVEVELSINGGFWWNAGGVVMGNETNWTYPFTPTGDGTYEIRARAIDVYGAYSDVATVNVNVDQCSDLIPLSGTFKPAGDVKTGTIQTVSIDVANNGVGSCGAFNVELNIKNSVEVTVLDYIKSFPAGLGAGGTGTVSKTWNVSSTVDNYTITVKVDNSGTVNELNELNNDYSTVIKSTTFPPESIVNYPAGGSSLNYNSIKTGLNITGIASDDGWITGVEVRINRTAGYDSGWVSAIINVTGSNASWSYAWTPPALNGVYSICSIATDNNGYRQTTPYCVNVNVNGCMNVTQLNVSRSGWKLYPSAAPWMDNCTGPVNWTKQSYNDAGWANITLPRCTDNCTKCDYYYRKTINIPGTPLNMSYKFGSDDSMEFWVNENFIAQFGECHVSGCRGSGSLGGGMGGACCVPAESDTVWRKPLTMVKGNNIVAVHVSELDGREYFDMIFNVTYNSCDV